MKNSGIYIIKSIQKPERFYIGSAVNMQKRRNVHFHSLNNKKHHSPKLQRHFDKYGINDLEFLVLEYCDRQLLLNKEQFYINTLSPYFNCSLTAGSRMGCRASKETKLKLSISHKNMSEEGRRNISIASKGRKHKPMTDEVKNKISLAHKGKALSVEHKTKLSESHKGLKSWLGKKHRDDSKKKISDAKKGHKYGSCPQERRDKISKSLSGRKRNPEIFKKMWETRRIKKIA